MSFNVCWSGNLLIVNILGLNAEKKCADSALVYK
jgi:hypothetical protein